jgi:4-hydroxybenzoate polyprenyltransferase
VPLLASAGLHSSLSDLNFWLLAFSTILIAASGYIINDYFDVKIDSINKPNRIFIDRTIKRHIAMFIHWVFTGVAVVIGFYVAWEAGSLKLGMINPIVAALLWFYSTGYKRQAVVGNIVVSFLTGLVVLVVVLYEQELFSGKLSDAGFHAAYTIFVLTFFYFIFAFLVSMMREIVKDMEDIKGDENYGCRTLPIVIGVNKTKVVVYLLGIIVVLLVGFVQYISIQRGGYLSAIYLMQAVQIPVFISLWLLYDAESQKEYNRVSTFIKVVMLMGILTIAYFYIPYM